MDSTVIAALIGAGGVVVTIAGTLGGTILGARLNQAGALKTARDMQEIERHKYTQDRLWDARKEAYTAIIAQLRATAKAAEKIHHRFNDDDADAEGYFQSAQYGPDTHILWETWRGTIAEYEKARLLLSDDFVAGFEQVQTNLDAVDEDGIPPMRSHEVYVVFNGAITPMLETAKREIAPQLPARIA